jgi:hypothetical protein
MKILFLGNSLLTNYYKIYLHNNSIFGPNVHPHFFIDIGGWGPSIKIKNGNIIPSDRKDKDIYPDIIHPANLTEIDVSSFDFIIIISLGFLGNGLETTPNITTYGQLFEFVPKVNEFTDIPISKDAYINSINGYLNSQSGIKLLDSLKNVNNNVIILEQPVLNELIQYDSNWNMNKLYKKPIDAISFFNDTRRKFLFNKCFELNFIFIPSLYDTFTPSNQKCEWGGDYFHVGVDYSLIEIDLIKNILFRT